MGLDGAYVHAKGQPSRAEGWFEGIVGKSLPTPDKRPKCFGFVSRYDPEPQPRLAEWLEGQGLQRNQPVTFLSDGGDTVRALPTGLYPRSEHLLVSKRFVKKQQMQWTLVGAHLLLHIRLEVLNGDWRATLSRWSAGLREPAGVQAV